MKMSLLSLTFIAIFITLCQAQNLTSNTNSIFLNGNSSATFTITNTQTGVVSCNLSTVTNGYSIATIQQLSSQGQVSNFQLSNTIVGRVNNIICGISGSNAASLTIIFSVRPPITALACGLINAIISSDRSTSANVVVTFSDALTSNAWISCTSANVLANNFTVSSQATSTTINLIFGSGVRVFEDVTCTFSMDPIQNSFQFTVNFITAAVSFYPSTITTDSPSVTMNLYINFTPLQNVVLNCYGLVNVTNPQCSNVSSISSTWNLTTRITFPGNTAPTMQTISLLNSGYVSGGSDNITVMCCNSQFLATAAVNLVYPAVNSTLLASTAETVYPYIQFYQLSQCPCDLTVNQCDLNCCCDTACDCSSSNVIPITGPYGGFFNDAPRYSCQSPDQITTDPFHPLLCVQFNTTNNLGYFYNNTALLKTGDAFQSTLGSVSSNSFQFTFSTSAITSNQILAYSASGATSTFLYLPKVSVNSISCDIYSPIVLYEPYTSSCPYQVTSANCMTTIDPRLTYANYLISSTALQTNCISNISLLNINQSTPVFTFYSNSSSGTWDNGFTLPSSPILSSTTCDNVVTSVNYTIAYNTSGIVYVRADIVLGSALIDGTLLYQSFSVNFLNTNVNISSNPSYISAYTAANLLVSSQTSTSGLFGYEDGLPVLLNNSIPMTTMGLSTTGQCQSQTNGRNVLFYKDSFIQCQYTFNSNTCAAQRIEAQSYLDTILTNNLVAVYGSPQNTNDYVSVVYVFNNNTNASIPSNNVNITTTVVPVDSIQNYCANVTTGVLITIYYSPQGKVRGQYINNIIGVRKEYVLGNLSTLNPSGTSPSSATQITLTYAVEFILRSANIQGSQNTDNVAQVICNFDVCIEELLYPWLLQYEGKQGFYEQAFGVMLLGLAVFLLATTYPWW